MTNEEQSKLDDFDELCGKTGTHMDLASELEELGFEVNMDSETAGDSSLSRIVLPGVCNPDGYDRVIGTILGDSDAVIE